VEECATKNPFKRQPIHTIEEIREILGSEDKITLDSISNQNLLKDSPSTTNASNVLPECDEAFNLYYSLQDSDNGLYSFIYLLQKPCLPEYLQ